MPKANPNRKLKLTDPFLKKVQPELRDVIFWDTIQPGLCVKVTPKGKRSFKVVYRHGFKLRWFHIDTYPAIGLADARKIARTVRARAALGEDPHGEKVELRRAGKIKGRTFDDIAQEYFKRAEHRSVHQYRGHFDRHLKPKLGHREAQSLTSGDFIGVANRLEAKGKLGSIGPVLAAAQAMLRWAMNKQLVDFSHNPVREVDRPKKTKKTSRRAFTHEELKKLWPVLNGMNSKFGPLLKIMMFTGQRGDEVRKMRWEDIEGDWWTQPTNKEDRVHRVYLAPTLRGILDDLGPEDKGLLFPSQKNTPHREIPTLIMNQVRKASGIPDLTPHMFRHTANTEMSRIKIKHEHRSKVLNHAEGGVTAIYGHYDFDEEKQAALAKLEQHLLKVVGS